MSNSNHFRSLIPLFVFFAVSLIFLSTVKSAETAENGTNLESTRFTAGVVLDMKSKMGAMANKCMAIALSDFYARHPSYTTRLSLQRWDSHDQVSSSG
ncbi:glutamate receptor 2.9-like protein [Corchorus olitorius]|uniref:Glutamate receptor 2.9-like protein n=1 Tax=Corchorus olitorius TaxID=93759 RepID=A0A1R3J4V5_9ROSI|nr:glutamate receptor 2.9-like protein [Corchorus olitorius]